MPSLPFRHDALRSALVRDFANPFRSIAEEAYWALEFEESNGIITTDWGCTSLRSSQRGSAISNAR